MKIKDIKSFCGVCGSIFDNNRLKYCKDCSCKLTKVGEYDQEYSEISGTYKLCLNFQFGEPR